MNKFQCPKCGSESFVTDPNRYDVLKFVEGDFQIEKSEFINDECRVFCRECGTEVNLTASIQRKKLILVNSW